MRRATAVRLAAGGAVLVLGGAGASAALADTGTRVEGHYRVATVATGEVHETLDLTGSVESVSRRDEAFAVAGTVDAVAVALGQHVEAGDELATLDTADLQSALDDAEDALAKAKQALSDDLEAQSATYSASSASGGMQQGSGATLDDRTLQQLLQQLGTAGTALEQCDADGSGSDSGSSSDSTSDSDSGSSSGDASGATPTGSPTATPGDTATAAPGDQPADTATASDGTGGAASCTDTAAQAIDQVVASLQRAQQQAATQAEQQAAQQAEQQAAAEAAFEDAKPTAADLVVDRAAIAAAEAQVEIAQQDLDAHVLTAGIAGTVAQVAIAAGDAVAAGSTTEVITILGDDGYQLSTTVSLSQVSKLQTGQTATVTLPALGKTYQGTVAAVGVTNVATDSSTPSYDVTIAIDAAGDELRTGSAATVAVDVADAADVLTVPLSAVSTADGVSTVQVLQDGSPTSVEVTTGAVGLELVEIDAGLEAGQEVVLADLDEAVPSATSESSSSGLSSLTGSTTGGLTGAGGFSGSGFTGGSGFTRPGD